jgi:hypothetical protein
MSGRAPSVDEPAAGINRTPLGTRDAHIRRLNQAGYIFW